MFLNELFNRDQVQNEAEVQTQLVVFYPGRFQPFHLGHRDVFASLQGKFGRDAVYIATSNKTDLPKSPFNFSEKVAFMNAAGVDSDRIVQVASPYKLPEQFDPAHTIFVVAVGAPDAQRLNAGGYKKDGTPGYFQVFKNLKDCVTADQHGYVIIAEERHKDITLNGQQVDVSHGTDSRNAWNMVRNDAAGRTEYLKQMFGRNDPELGRILDKIPVNEDSNMPVAVDSASAIPGISVLETIRKVAGGYRLVSKKGKNLGTYPSKSGAEKRERQVQYFKHMGESVEDNDYMAGHCHVMAIALKQLHPDWQIRAHLGWDKEAEDDSDYRIDHVYIVAPDGTAYDCRGRFDNEQQLVGPNETGGVETQFVDYSLDDIKNDIRRGELKSFTRQDIQKAIEFGKQALEEDAAGVGVVKNSKDPRYVMATAGDQNDVTAQTLPKEMKAYGLIGRKNPAAKKQ